MGSYREGLKVTRRFNCPKCSPTMMGLKVPHDLSLTLYSPKIRYACRNCGTEKWIRIPRTKTQKAYDLERISQGKVPFYSSNPFRERRK